MRSSLFGGSGAFSFSAVQLCVMEKTLATFADFEAEAERFVTALSKDAHGATLVTLSGELGAGKTAFTKAVASKLGVEEVVTSPTFVLEKIYLLGGPTPKFGRLVHIDAYRLESGKELAPLGFDELLQNSGNLILLEWPEKVAEALPVPSVRISIVANPDESRTIVYG